MSRKLDHVQATDATRLMPGLGPKSTAWLAEVGIDTPEVLREVGAVAAYLRLKHWNPRLVTLNALWGLHAALAGIPWTAIDAATKERLLAEVRAAKRGKSQHTQPCA
jgi:DNA transformation protein and related proteins